ncbi:hypothetical protein TRFO_33957 [Tritrichomonas foetus]|uniref:CWH43-like N-terminal domain-containing protein n=1 Tax=Tritrichomonas foetus TaxID=1144522 RepID=A0A1J4JKC5_9EUKA|nr:hypothetical protein TRFO_33957 [Tritrichomonas foetus]|eukprot:OHS99582.1 hypothetical protein TRFO_33957 [Tritrichomonas foetus]
MSIVHKKFVWHILFQKNYSIACNDISGFSVFICPYIDFQNMEKKEKKSILYSPFSLVCIISICPIFIVFICYAFAYFNNHITFQKSIPMISQVMVRLPECRIYSVCMNLVAWTALPIFLIIDRILKLKCKIEKCHKHVTVYCLRWLMNICAGFSFFGMIGMASINIDERIQFHNNCVCIFVVFMTLYFFLIDYEMVQAKLNVKTFHVFLSFVGISLFTVSYILMKKDDDFLQSVSAVIQIIAIPCMSMKFLIIWKTLPASGILITHKKEQ